MNRLIKLCIIVALLTATTAQGDVSVSADDIEIQINGNPASGQEFTVGQEINITCIVVASASISNIPDAINYRARVESALRLFDGPISSGESPLISDPYIEDVTNVSGAVAEADNELLSITYTLTLTVEGFYTIRAGAVAWAWYEDAEGWHQAGVAVSGPVYPVYLTFNVVDVIEVDIDIKPGSTPNTMNLGSNGVIPVAILSSADFDAPLLVDTTTVQLQGKAGVRVKGNGDPLATERDVNGDGYVDLELKVEVENLEPGDIQDGIAEITGLTIEGQKFSGTDTVTIVPPE